MISGEIGVFISELFNTILKLTAVYILLLKKNKKSK